MKRDLDLIRDILIATEQSQGMFSLKIADRDQAEVAYNAQLAQDAGFLEAKFATQHTVFVQRLTYEGHEFLDASRDSKLWLKAKEQVLAATGTLTVEAVKQVLQQLIRHALGS